MLAAIIPGMIDPETPRSTGFMRFLTLFRVLEFILDKTSQILLPLKADQQSDFLLG